MSNRGTKRGPPSDGGHITVTAHGLQDGDEVFFRIKRSSSHRLPREQTPDDLEMMEGDEIHVTPHCDGPQPAAGSGHITVKVKGLDGSVVSLRTRRNAELKNLMNRYYERQSVDHPLRFIFQGRQLRGEETPDELAMTEAHLLKILKVMRYMQCRAMIEHGAQSAMAGITISNQDTKPPSEDGHITLKMIQDLDGSRVFFRIKRSTRLTKLMNRYCECHSVDHGSFGFIFHGRRIRGEQTPDELALEEGDQIHALMIRGVANLTILANFDIS